MSLPGVDGLRGAGYLYQVIVRVSGERAYLPAPRRFGRGPEELDSAFLQLLEDGAAVVDLDDDLAGRLRTTARWRDQPHGPVWWRITGDGKVDLPVAHLNPGVGLPVHRQSTAHARYPKFERPIKTCYR